MRTTWVSWRLHLRGTESTRAHAGIAGVRPMDVANGCFPLECGRWAPDGWDATVEESRLLRRCKKCEAVLAKRERQADPPDEETTEEKLERMARFTGYPVASRLVVDSERERGEESGETER